MKQMKSHCAFVSAGEATREGKDGAIVLATVPVRVKVDKGNKFTSTYTFLDLGSSASYYTESHEAAES